MDVVVGSNKLAVIDIVGMQESLLLHQCYVNL